MAPPPLVQMATNPSASAMASPRLRWSWLWGQRTDLLWNLLPFWLGFVFLAAVYLTAGPGPAVAKQMWNVSLGGHSVHVMSLILFLYGPLVDAPHLWATVARTYTDREEWATRRRLFLVSLLAFAIGPAIVLLPYALRAVLPLPAHFEDAGWVVWTTAFSLYALHHINKQHWGFVCLYNRKNGDTASKLETRVDALFFQVAIWLPYAAMLTAPWYVDFDGKPYGVLKTAIGSTTLGAVLHTGCEVAFFALAAAYALFQVSQWRRGLARNGTKLVYVATILGLYFLTFALDPRIAAFWVIITGTGHCAQYHAVVWAYGKKRYAAPASARSLPQRIFGNVWLYIALGVLFGLVTLQGPGAMAFKAALANLLQASFFAHAFAFLDRGAGVELGMKLGAAFISGVRLHHFYVDSKIWKVSKSAALARNLNVEMPARAV